MMKSISIALMISHLWLGVSAQTKQDTQSLESVQPVEREIAGGQTHTYRIRLKAGQFLHVLVEQKGIDVALALTSPDGKQLIESDLTGLIGWREPLSFEAKQAGDYRLVVRGNGEATTTGAYQARQELKAAANAQDRKRLVAEQLLNEAAGMIRRRDFQQSIEKRQLALGLWRELGDREWERYTLFSIGRCYEGLSRYDKAAENHEQALAIARELKDRLTEARTLSNLQLTPVSLRSREGFNQRISVYTMRG
jgi:tetratricopeptide (TPR) repeat protein